MAIIEINHVTKVFQLGQLRSLKDSALDVLARLRGQPALERASFKALDDVSFAVERGEVLGIIGHNGAGKSTLLKMLARITTPTHGAIKVHGSIAPLIEVGAGLVPELTGRENIYLNGAILGMRRDEIRKKFDEIVAFAELEEFIDTPIKRFSSGMKVRLGFSIATCVVADILIVDEVLSVGDLAFQRKCFDRMEDMIKRQGKTVLLVSHNIRQVERLCSRVVFLDHGTVQGDGAPTEICDRFYASSEKRILAQRASSPTKKSSISQTGEVSLQRICVTDENGNPITEVRAGCDINVSITFFANEDLERPVFGVGIQTPDFVNLTGQASADRINSERIPKGAFRVQCRFLKPPFLAGLYTLRIGVGVGELMHTAFYGEDLLSFRIEPKDSSAEQSMREGIITTNADWKLEYCDTSEEATA
jgi:ABC-type polysaccharide/polyol phosphate transport system ATPase subunit